MTHIKLETSEEEKEAEQKEDAGGKKRKRVTIIERRVSTEHVQYFTALYFHNHNNQHK
jgi:hypothetical protein